MREIGFYNIEWTMYRDWVEVYWDGYNFKFGNGSIVFPDEIIQVDEKRIR